MRKLSKQLCYIVRGMFELFYTLTVVTWFSCGCGMKARNAIGTCHYRSETFDIGGEGREAMEYALVLER